MYQVVQVRLREVGKILYYDTKGVTLEPGDYCIVEAERGMEYGQVLTETESVLDSNIERPLRKVVRVATKEDMAQIQRNKNRIKEIFKTCSRKIQERGMAMKLVGAEYSFDRSKLIFYFSAEGRIDFRELVKDLAAIFKARIEMRQIGVRDEAKLMGGFGPCGRPLCCAKFLKDFEPVTIRMAKEQKLPLNPAKISGLCGRLMCCLAYEHQTYKQLLQGLPKEGQRIKTESGPGRVISVNVIVRCCTVELDEGGQVQISYKK